MSIFYVLPFPNYSIGEYIKYIWYVEQITILLHSFMMLSCILSLVATFIKCPRQIQHSMVLRKQVPRFVIVTNSNHGILNYFVIVIY
jgi:hypothetical protein